MSWQDEARENAYFQAALNSNNDAELARNMRAADKAVDAVDDLISGIGRALAEPTPPPKPQPSSGGSLGGLLALGALAGGAYLLSKVFGGSDDNKNSKSVNQPPQQTTSQSLQPPKPQSYQSATYNYYKANEKSDEAWRLYCLKDYTSAIKLYNEAIQLNSNSYKLYFYRSRCHEALGDKTKAQADLAKARELGL